jgi:hypothetical protein
MWHGNGLHQRQRPSPHQAGGCQFEYAATVKPRLSEFRSGLKKLGISELSDR